MAINITQFAPPGTVSKLVWDDDMEPDAGKIFKGDLTGNVTGNVTGDLTGNVTGNVTGDVTGNVSGYTTKVWSVSAGGGVIYLSSGASTSYSIERQIYQLPPKETMTGSVKLWYGAGCHPTGTVVKIRFLGVNMNTLQTSQITGTATAYTIPAGCNSIYVDGYVAYVGANADVYMSPMILS